MAGRRSLDERARCSLCGSTHLVLGVSDAALCAHCYLERGAEHGI